MYIVLWVQWLGVFCSRFQDIADDSPDAYDDIKNTIDNSNSDSEDDFDDLWFIKIKYYSMKSWSEACLNW